MYAFIDIETTGLDPQSDRIIEIAILLYDGQQVTSRFCSYVNPEGVIPPQIRALTGIDPASLENAPPFFKIARRVVELTEGRTIAGHNVRFDYSFLKAEFKRFGYDYQRKQFCTLRLARKSLPGLSSYKLDAVCNALGITRETSHRALADAEASLNIFEALHQNRDPDSASPFATATALPPGISREHIDALPNDAGVYIFYGHNERLLYIGKSRDIRKRVMSHFYSDLKSQRERELKELTREIRFIRTGSELIALLLESDLVKQKQPVYNRALRQARYRYGLYQEMKDGYIAFTLRRTNGDSDALMAFVNGFAAARFLRNATEKYQLCQKYAHFHRSGGACFNYHLHRCLGACIGKEQPETYNLRARKMLQQFEYNYRSFFIIGPGRQEGESSLVFIQNGIYRGYGHCPAEMIAEDWQALHKFIRPGVDNQDVRRIIQRYLNSDHGDEIRIVQPE